MPPQRKLACRWPSCSRALPFPGSLACVTANPNGSPTGAATTVLVRRSPFPSSGRKTGLQRESGVRRGGGAGLSPDALGTKRLRSGQHSYRRNCQLYRRTPTLGGTGTRGNVPSAGAALSIWWRSIRRLAAAGSPISRCSYRITPSLAMPARIIFRGLGKKRTGTPHSHWRGQV